jgi:hypothetical protein
LFGYAHLAVGAGLWLVVVASVVNGIGAAFFFPANSAAVDLARCEHLTLP